MGNIQNVEDLFGEMEPTKDFKLTPPIQYHDVDMMKPNGERALHYYQKMLLEKSRRNGALEGGRHQMLTCIEVT